MDSFLQVHSNSDGPGSPTHSFSEVASICPLITPSPPTNDLINPLPEPSQSDYAIGEELATILQKHVEDDDKCAADSASSSSSALAEPSCAQLLNHRNSNYHHIIKDEHTAAEETAGKVQPLQLTFRNPPENYFFMSWNWPVIRMFSFVGFLSGLVIMLGMVITMIVNLEPKCNPETLWYQGRVFYEVFPASFYSGKIHGEYGDFKGLIIKRKYFKDLGVGAVRLNSIFKTPNYPEDYHNVTTLMEIAPHLGTIQDFTEFVEKYRELSIFIVLDIPVYPFLAKIKTNFEDPVADALKYWSEKGVKGFYLKGIEHFSDDQSTLPILRNWRNFINKESIFIVNDQFANPLMPNFQIFDLVNLVDVHLDVSEGLEATAKHLEQIQNSTIFTNPNLHLWVHWSLGNASNPFRLANLPLFKNSTLGGTLLQLMLPGTPSIFYGNEIGLRQVLDHDGDRKDLQHLFHLPYMVWANSNKELTFKWLFGENRKIELEQVEAVKKMIRLRHESPAIFFNSVYKEGVKKGNFEVLYSRNNLLVIQRWYPRRKSYVVVSNLGASMATEDLSNLLYCGTVLIGPRSGSVPESISFKNITLNPGESIVVELV